jgi:hypothetical protein
MNAPQIIMIVLIAISGTVTLVNHGKPRENWNFGVWLFAAAVEIGLLIWGGFFG